MNLKRVLPFRYKTFAFIVDLERLYTNNYLKLFIQLNQNKIYLRKKTVSNLNVSISTFRFSNH